MAKGKVKWDREKIYRILDISLDYAIEKGWDRNEEKGFGYYELSRNFGGLGSLEVTLTPDESFINAEIRFDIMKNCFWGLVAKNSIKKYFGTKKGEFRTDEIDKDVISIPLRYELKVEKKEQMKKMIDYADKMCREVGNKRRILDPLSVKYQEDKKESEKSLLSKYNKKIVRVI